MADFRPSQVTGNIDVSGTVDLSRLDLVRYGTLPTVVASTITTILSYTAGADTNISLITASGEAPAKFELFIGGVSKGALRSGPSRSVAWSFPFPLAQNNAIQIDIKVTHFFTGETFEFEAGIYAFA